MWCSIGMSVAKRYQNAYSGTRGQAWAVSILNIFNSFIPNARYPRY